MKKTGFLKIIFIFFFSLEALISYSQQQLRLDSSLIQMISKENFKIIKGYNQLPRYIKRCLNNLESAKFRITSGTYNAADAVINLRPNRKIVYAGKSKFFYLLSYLHGGKGLHQHTLLIRISNDSVQNIDNLIFPYHNNLNDFVTLLEKGNFSIQPYNEF